jgi:uncharacterized protein with HEPN domain
VRDDRTRLNDMLEAIERIRRQSDKGRAAFDGDELVQTWIVHHLQILGEAAARLSPAVRAPAPVRWNAIVGMRNILVHTYFEIDREAVWRVVERDLGPLEAEIRRMLAESA